MHLELLEKALATECIQEAREGEDWINEVHTIRIVAEDPGVGEGFARDD